MRSAARPPASDQLGQGPAADPQQRLQLEGPVLGVAEAQPEPGIGFRGRVDVRDAPSVAPDTQRVVDAADPQGSRRSWQPAAEQPHQGAHGLHGRIGQEAASSAAPLRQENPSVYSVG